MTRLHDIYADGRPYYMRHAVYDVVREGYHNCQSIADNGYADGYTPSTYDLEAVAARFEQYKIEAKGSKDGGKG